MNVVRDLLDKAVVDRDGREMGRVDGVVIDLEKSQPPRLASILIGPAALAHRLHPPLERWVQAAEKRLGADRGRPVRIDFRDIDEIDRPIRLRLSIRETAAAAIEEWLRTWVLKLPGSR